MNTVHELVEKHINWANKLAHKKKRLLPSFIDIEDVKSAAYLGLVEAATRYDPEMNAEFTTFSYCRIWGAIQDYLRDQVFLKNGKYHQTLSLDSINDDSEKCLKETIAAKPESNIEECLDVITINLDNQAKKIIKSYFIEDYSMKEVGQNLGLSESRVSQLIKIYKNQIRQFWEKEELASQLAA